MIYHSKVLVATCIHIGRPLAVSCATYLTVCLTVTLPSTPAKPHNDLEAHLSTYQIFFYCIVHASPIETPKKRVSVALVKYR